MLAAAANDSFHRLSRFSTIHKTSSNLGSMLNDVNEIIPNDTIVKSKGISYRIIKKSKL